MDSKKKSQNRVSKSRKGDKSVKINNYVIIRKKFSRI